MLKDFLKYQAQTSPHPLAMEVSHAKGGAVGGQDIRLPMAVDCEHIDVA